ncbi:TetR/AcrR family transcriptional regulator [Gracilibacillus caseinilyticus]|uniref:TetR/AcrR family transcriptional regulator n=1 Tax=Gracilibacillus caseinilyticus TaxID=2932256 RepID=A0ABY4EXS2_9BACI|nr:TetR/AcrR family transcriptional regulator [Gracilibacillus caseinilyticus]UOQ49207.1 TetR/AcrR family transcriptional regulator [Gracilibacillus caseinilyticus]
METKQKLMQTALQLFADNGYNETSVQEIAMQTGISKGGFYSFFPSKIDLMLEIVDNYHQSIQNVANKMDGTNIDLASYLHGELEIWIEHRLFFHVIFKELPPKKDESFTQKMEQLHETLHNHHREYFYLTYGQQIAPYVTDLVIMLEGIMKEYMLYMMLHDKHMNAKQLSSWISRQMDGLVQNLANQKPFLQGDKEHTIEQLLEDIKESVLQLQLSNQNMLLHTIEEIAQQIRTEQDPFQLELLFHYLKSEKVIEIQTIQIERMWKQGGL